MKIRHKQILSERKCGGCNYSAIDFYQLNGWDKKDWLCGVCFAEDLFQGKYTILTERDAKSLNKQIEIKDYVIDKFKKYLRREKQGTDKTTTETKLNDFIEINLDLII